MTVANASIGAAHRRVRFPSAASLRAAVYRLTLAEQRFQFLADLDVRSGGRERKALATASAQLASAREAVRLLVVDGEPV